MSFNNLISCYKKKLGADGATIRDEYVNSFQENLLGSFEDNVQYYVVEYKNRVTEVFNNVGCHVFQVKKSGTSELYDDYRKLVLQDFNAVVLLGDIFRFDGYNWMVINTNNIKSLTNDMIVRRVNHALEWINSTGKEISEDCIIDYNFIYLTSIEDNEKYMRIGDKQYALVLPNNDDTKQFTRDKRFIVDGLAYRIVDINRKVKNLGNGLCLIVFEEHQVNTTTDLIRADGTGIADYYNKPIYTIEVLNPTISLSVGSTIQLQYEIKLDGNIVTDKAVIFTQNSDFISISNTGLVTGLENGATTITVSLADNANVYDNASVAVSSSPSSNYAEEIQGDESIVINEFADYEIYRLNNGVDTGNTYTFIINSSNATLSITNGNKCRITAGKTKNVNIILTAKNNTTLTEFTKNINIVGIW